MIKVGLIGAGKIGPFYLSILGGSKENIENTVSSIKFYYH